MPETRLLTLEQLENVFNEVTTFQFASHATRGLLYHVGLRATPPERLYRSMDERRHTVQPNDPESQPGTPTEQQPPNPNNDTDNLLSGHDPRNDFEMHGYGRQGAEATRRPTYGQDVDGHAR